MTGIGVLLAPDAAAFRAAPLGAGFVLMAAMGWAAGTVTMKTAGFSRSVAQMTGWQLIIGGMPIAIAALWRDPPLHDLSLSHETILVLAYIIALPMIFGQWAWFKALDRLPGTVAAVGSLAVPVVGLVSSALFLGEPLGARSPRSYWSSRRSRWCCSRRSLRRAAPLRTRHYGHERRHGPTTFRALSVHVAAERLRQPGRAVRRCTTRARTGDDRRGSARRSLLQRHLHDTAGGASGGPGSLWAERQSPTRRTGHEIELPVADTRARELRLHGRIKP